MDNTDMIVEAQRYVDTATHTGVQKILNQISLARHVALDDPLDLVQPTPSNTMDVPVSAIMTRRAIEQLAEGDESMLNVLNTNLGFLASAIEESVVLDALAQIPAQERCDPRSVLDDMMSRTLSMHLLDHVIWSRIVSAQAFTNEFIPNPAMLSGDPNVLDFMLSPGHFRFGSAEPAVIYTDAFRHPMLRSMPSNTWCMVEAFPCFYRVFDGEENPVIKEMDPETISKDPIFRDAQEPVFTLAYQYKIAIDLPNPTDIKVHRIMLT